MSTYQFVSNPNLSITEDDRPLGPTITLWREHATAPTRDDWVSFSPEAEEELLNYLLARREARNARA